MTPHKGIHLTDLVREVRAHGGTASIARGTGEIVLSHPRVGRVRVNSRRKDVPRCAVSFLRAVLRATPIEKRSLASLVLLAENEEEQNTMIVERVYVTACDACEHADTHTRFSQAERDVEKHYRATGHRVRVWTGHRHDTHVTLEREVGL